eukprot:CAMPEP_0204200930 /NCGR_PEP_ID=MMETSP0361-20130328/67098_1 /ASSEMBLY_ACC=CAM_ASM_000343 /TAXON_ID=268821 /ORGANISM="Scrippsiella Hangoei, Strain SHTV-5" /LENGTH=46 /DNA_ID= /DNA_START= /DNA_END= /DNA_ORIENTATION=
MASGSRWTWGGDAGDSRRPPQASVLTRRDEEFSRDHAWVRAARGPA